jgi:hypothetical protein
MLTIHQEKVHNEFQMRFCYFWIIQKLIPVAFCDKGPFGLDLDLDPRSKWAWKTGQRESHLFHALHNVCES